MDGTAQRDCASPDGKWQYFVNSALAAGPGQFGALQAVAPSFGVELRPLDLHDPGGIEHGIAAFAKGSNNGLIVTAEPDGDVAS